MRRRPSPESRVWAEGERVPVVAFAPALAAAGADGRPSLLSTPSKEAFESEVLEPLLLAALATARVPALPPLRCDVDNPWLRRTSAPAGPPAARSYDWRGGECRTAVCSNRIVVAGTTSAEELQEAESARARAAYASPFANGSGAEEVARARLSCTPFGSHWGAHPLNNKFCKSNKHGHLMHAPVWSMYRRRLGAYADAPHAFTLGIPATHPAAAHSPATNVTYAALVAALRLGAAATVAYLPARLRVVAVPRDVAARLSRYCMCRWREGDRELRRCGH